MQLNAYTGLAMLCACRTNCTKKKRESTLFTSLFNAVRLLISFFFAPLDVKSDGSPQNLESILPGTDKSRLSRLPADDVPDVVDVGSLAVEVLSTQSDARR